MPYAQIDDGIRLYYELTGPEDAPVILQLGGGLFGRHNFGLVNDGFRETFRLLSFDARGYGASSSPREAYTIEGWAADAAALLDSVGLERALVHGTSMGGMIAIAFTALYPEKTIAACADVAFAKCDVYRRTVFRVWRRMAETMPWDEFSDHVTTQAVGAKFIESPEGENIFQLVRDIVGLNDPYTVRQACLAMENMDLSPLVPKIERPLLMTNGTHDILCPPDLAPSGLGARKMTELNEHIELVERLGGVPVIEGMCRLDARGWGGGFFALARGPAFAPGAATRQPDARTIFGTASASQPGAMRCTPATPAVSPSRATISAAISMPAAFASSPSRPSIRSKVASSTSMPGMLSCMCWSMRVLRGGVTPTRNGARSGIPAALIASNHSSNRSTS